MLPDALPLPVPKPLLHARRQLLKRLAQHALRLEDKRVIKDRRVAVRTRQDKNHGLVVRNLILAAGEQHGALVGVAARRHGARHRLDVVTRRREAQPQGLADDGLDVPELREVLGADLRRVARGPCGARPGPDDAVELLPGSGDAGLVLDEVVDLGAEHARRRRAADGHAHDLVDDLALRQALARLGVFSLHQGPEDVPAARGVLLSVLHHVGGKVLAHDPDCVLELAAVEQPVEDTGAVRPLHRLGGAVLHALQHRVALSGVDAVQLPPEHGHRRGLEVEPVQLVHQVDPGL